MTDFRKEDGIILKKLMIALIKFYKKYISPMKTTKCPYCPSCSTYGLEAVEKYGAVKGGALAAWRIIRCNLFQKEDMIRFPNGGIFSVRNVIDRI